MTAQRFSPPTTLTKPVQEELHGISLIDSYRHLEDKEDPQVIDWTKKQHDATMEYLRLTAQSFLKYLLMFQFQPTDF